MKSYSSVLILLVVAMLAYASSTRSADERLDPAKELPVEVNEENQLILSNLENLEAAILAGGCFWCIESAFEKVEGVTEAISGYTGGERSNPKYQEVASGQTKHIESVVVLYDPEVISYEQILEHFWRQIDPTDEGGQFADRGHQYSTAIFYRDDQQKEMAQASKQALSDSSKFEKPIVTKIQQTGPFYVAEAYHQDYYKKNPARYRSYFFMSGRGPFLQKTWGDEE